MKKFIPQSLLGRFLLIIIIPTVLAQIVATYIFYERHWSNVSSHMVSSLVGEISMIININKDKELRAHKNLAEVIDNSLYIKTYFKQDSIFKFSHNTLPSELKYLAREINKNTNSMININYINDKSDIHIEAPAPDGLINIIASRKRLDNPTTYIFILWMNGSAFILLMLAIVFLRNQLKPISRLAIAAEKFGKGQSLDNFKPEGALEVRRASLAFLQMKARIERQITQRTEMLAGVSHDLRTPLTRIRLELALMSKDIEVKEIEQDLIEMENMIQNYLDFARGEGDEKSELVDLASLIKDLLSYYDKSFSQTSINISYDKFTLLRPQAIRRMLKNLLENASAYASEIKISLHEQSSYIKIIIEDNGPGIDNSMRELVFKPFYRMDPARNLNTSGVGLGLAIVKDIITSHGGRIKLEDSKELGGLKIVISLPN